MRNAWVGWAIAALALGVFLLIAWQVQIADSAVWQFDKRIAHQAQQHAQEHPGVLDFAVNWTDAGGVPVMTALVIVGWLLLLICGQTKLAWFWLLSAALGCVINVTAKNAIDRPRPDESLRDKAVHERNASYPSGHAMGSTITYGALGFVGFTLLRRRGAKWTLALVMAAVVLTILWSRVYLRAHWFSDVVGGAAVGLAWLTLCIKAWR